MTSVDIFQDIHETNWGFPHQKYTTTKSYYQVLNAFLQDLLPGKLCCHYVIFITTLSQCLRQQQMDINADYYRRTVFCIKKGNWTSHKYQLHSRLMGHSLYDRTNSCISSVKKDEKLANIELPSFLHQQPWQRSCAQIRIHQRHDKCWMTMHTGSLTAHGMMQHQWQL